MTTLQQNEREWISAIRGKYEERIMCEVSTPSGVLALVAVGYENYPEPSYFTVSVDGSPLCDSDGIPYSHYHDTAVMYQVRDVFPQYDLSKLISAVGAIEELPW